jgi:hypothetical protein
MGLWTLNALSTKVQRAALALPHALTAGTGNRLGGFFSKSEQEAAEEETTQQEFADAYTAFYEKHATTSRGMG